MGHLNISDIDVVRAWKDEEYRNSLSEEQKAQLPENPAGLIDLTDEAINGVVGGEIDCVNIKTFVAGCGLCSTFTAECGCPNTIWTCGGWLC